MRSEGHVSVLSVGVCVKRDCFFNVGVIEGVSLKIPNDGVIRSGCLNIGLKQD